MVGKVCMVTGCNTGVGLRTATALAKCGATVIFACRSKDKAMSAIESVKREAGSHNWSSSAKLLFIELDLSDLKSVSQCIKEIKKMFTKLDIVVLNAGLNTGGLTSDGLDARWQVNYLGHWYLISELFPLLTKAKGPNNNGGRVVLLSSVTHHLGDPSLFEQHCKGISDDFSTRMKQNASVYSDSKLAMNFLAFELQKKFDQNDDIDEVNGRISGRYDDQIIHEKATLLSMTGDANEGTTNTNNNHSNHLRARTVAVNPGAVASDIWRGIPWIVRKLLFDPLMTLTFLNTDEGAATSIHAALHPIPNTTSTSLTTIPPYYSPYWVPSLFGMSFPLPFETMGPFVGSRVCPQSLPTNLSRIAEKLWQQSDETVKAKLGNK